MTQDVVDVAAEREAIFLSAVLRDKEKLLLASTIVNTDSLSQQNAIIYHAAQQVVEAGDDISTISVLYHLNTNGMLDAAGGTEYVAAVQAADFYLDELTFKRTCEDIENLGRTRKIKEALITIANSDIDEDSDGVVGRIINEVYRINRTQTEPTLHINEILNDTGEGRIPLVSSTIAEVDKTLQGGFALGDYIIIAARPSVGKTAFAAQIALLAAIREVPVLIFSLEQNRKSLVARLRKATNDDVLASLPIWINTTSGMTIDQIMYHAQINQIRHGIQLVIVDYVGLVRGKRNHENTNEFIGRVSSSFQTMARKLNLVFIAVSQLNRDADKEGRKPELHDLRESGSLEQDADTVILLHRPRKQAEGKLNIAKQREGPIGEFDVEFDPNTLMFAIKGGMK